MNPFIPKGKGNIVIIDARVNEEVIKGLKELKLKVIKTIKCKAVDESIAYHPDIVIHPIDRNTLVIAPEVYDYYNQQLSKYGFNIIKGKSFLSKRYPLDISYNVARIGNIAIHRKDSTDIEIKERFRRNGINLIDVKQGYSKCSLALLGNNLGVTSDIPIYNLLKSKGYSVLLVSPGNIDLPGQNYGFIGGAFGNLSENVVLVSGHLDKHPEGEKIKAFAKENGKKLLFLSNDILLDVGTILVLEGRGEIFDRDKRM